MFKRIISATLSAFVIFAVVQAPAPASAAAYRHFITLDQHLIDKKLNMYINQDDAVNHDGWCYLPGNSANRKQYWSCTISAPRSNEEFNFPIVADGTLIAFGGRVHRAYRLPPAPNYLPYCYPSVFVFNNDYVKNYYCAYWVRL